MVQMGIFCRDFMFNGEGWWYPGRMTRSSFLDDHRVFERDLGVMGMLGVMEMRSGVMGGEVGRATWEVHDGMVMGWLSRAGLGAQVVRGFGYGFHRELGRGHRES
jgi:hypothetical protein